VEAYWNEGKPQKAELTGVMLENVRDIIQDYDSISILLVNLPAKFPF
jgi:hypothetical protein